jgi:hypothetical protein
VKLLSAPRGSCLRDFTVLPRNAGTIRITAPPNAHGRQLVKHHRYAVTIRPWASYTPVGGRQRGVGLYRLHITQPMHRR